MSLNTVAPQKKYGLITKPLTAPPKKLKKPANFDCFNELDDETESLSHDPRKDVNRMLVKKHDGIDKDLEKLYTSALEEDATIFDYDGSYEKFKFKEQESHHLSGSSISKAPTARYVDSLMATAKIREKEKDRIYERKLLKERKAEDEQYGDAPKFLTSAYKKKLEEDQKWNYEDRLADEIEMKTDVRSAGMQGFYSNLLTKNVALGGDVTKSALSAYTAGSQRQKMFAANDDSNKISGEIGTEMDTKNTAVSIELTTLPDEEDSLKRKKRPISDINENIIMNISTPSTMTAKVNSSVTKDKESTSLIDSTAIASEVEPPVEENKKIEITRSEIIMSAKERFLLRKQQMKQI